MLFKLLQYLLFILIPQGLLKYLLNFDCSLLGAGGTEISKTTQFLELLHLNSNKGGILINKWDSII